MSKTFGYTNSDYGPTPHIRHYLHNLRGLEYHERQYLTSSVEDFLDEIEYEDIFDLRCQRGNLVVCVSKDLVFYIEYNNARRLEIFGKDMETVYAFLMRYSSAFIPDVQETVTVDYYYRAGSNIHDAGIQIAKSVSDTIYPDLYPSIDIQKLNRAFSTSEDAILILQGAPGVGKTTFLKYMLTTGDYGTHAYVKDVDILRSDAFWASRTLSPYGIMVLDDLDFALGPRVEGGDNSIVSNMLSYSDGIFGRNKDAKIVITTNQPIESIDAALVRPGRCFDLLVLQALDEKEALRLWQSKLGNAEDTFYQHVEVDNGEVTQAALMSGHRILHDERRIVYTRNQNNTPSLLERLNQLGVRVSKDDEPVGFKV